MSRLDEIKERWRNWGNVLLRVRPLPGQPAVYVGVAEVQVPDVVQFVYGADGDVRVLLDEVERHLSTLESVRYALGKVARFASGQEVPPASDGPGLIGYLGGALSRMAAEAERLTREVESLHCNLRAMAGVLATVRDEGQRKEADVERLTSERDDARDDSTRFRHELKLAEGCLSKPGADVGGVIAGLRLAQKRETGTWAIPAETLRGGK